MLPRAVGVENCPNACDLRIIGGVLNEFDGLAQSLGRGLGPVLEDARYNIVAAVSKCVELEDD